CFIGPAGIFRLSMSPISPSHAAQPCSFSTKSCASGANGGAGPSRRPERARPPKLNPLQEETMPDLDQQRFVLGLTGGIACYKSAELLRRMQDHGATIDVVMTEAATHFITATTMQALSGRPVYVNAWDSRVPNSMAHINLTRGARAVVIAPASA